MPTSLRLAFALSLSFIAACLPAQSRAGAAPIESAKVGVRLHCGAGCLWSLQPHKGSALSFAPPVFEIDGKPIRADVGEFSRSGAPRVLPTGVSEYTVSAPFKADPQLRLELTFQLNPDTPVVRFRYTLHAGSRHALTNSAGSNRLTYAQFSLATFPRVKEISLSNFVELWHSFAPSEREVGGQSFADRAENMGPILAASDQQQSVLVAYEHGSQTPDAFLHYQLEPDRSVRLEAVKGNYVAGQALDADHSFTTLWIDAAVVDGDFDRLASAFRRFVLHSMAENSTTREPYIFYNTWNFQERNKWHNGRPYLESMSQERILREVDIAHRMGIDVFVLDTGWYEKTGDWTVSRARFPDNLKAVKARLDSYGMKLGLWFGPTSAAVSSQVVREHPEWRMSWHGKVSDPREVWETEKSYSMCMVSGYADEFAGELIRLAREVGVRYFKWDAIGQYGCDDPHHDHGLAVNSPQERADSYGFQLVGAMRHVADKVAAEVPGTIVDFDVTEGGRSMGLAWLASGKYFLINNGPYYQNYDVPIDLDRQNWNLFFQPGQARSWIARSPLTFDKWIPSVLFLTHYFPDDPQQWQQVSLASLILGQNGIWGDLPAVSDQGIAFLGDALSRYKRVAHDITESDPVVSGVVSGSPEIHEKLAPNGRGAVVLFATEPGRYTYITQGRPVSEHWTSGGGLKMEPDAEHHMRIDAEFDKPGAKIILFGVE